jgi:hypothetical protein
MAEPAGGKIDAPNNKATPDERNERLCHSNLDSGTDCKFHASICPTKRSNDNVIVENIANSALLARRCLNYEGIQERDPMK